MIPHTRTAEVKITFHGTDLVKAREEAGISQSSLADKLGVCRRNITRWERPTQVTVREETFQGIIEAIMGQ